MNETNIKSFMAHLPPNKHTELLETLQEYGINKYLIAHEKEPYSHYHFVIEFIEEPERNYHNFCKRIFINKYKLRGRAMKDKPRQYGALKKIENIQRMMAYTLKEGNYITNIETNQINKLIEISKQHTKYHTFREKTLKYLWDKNLNKPTNPIHFSPDERGLEEKVRREVINYYIQNEETNIKLSKSYIENIYLEYIIKHKKITKEDKSEILYHKFFFY